MTLQIEILFQNFSEYLKQIIFLKSFDSVLRVYQRRYFGFVSVSIDNDLGLMTWAIFIYTCFQNKQKSGENNYTMKV